MKRRVIAVGMMSFMASAATIGSAVAAAPVTITVLDAWGPGPWQAPLYKAWQEKLAALYPDIKVEFLQVSKGSTSEKLLSMVAAGDPPDVTLVSWPELAEQGLLLNLEPFFQTDSALKNAQFVPTSLEYCRITIDGRPFLWAYPGNSDSQPIWVNLDKFNEAGLAYAPDQPWTWDQFVANGSKLTRKDSSGKVSVWGFDAPRGWPGSIAPYIWSNGGNMFTRDASSGWVNQAVWENPKTVEAIDWYAGLSRAGVAPPYGTGAGFGAQTAAMTQSWMSLASNHFNFQFNLMPTPVPEAGMPVVNIANGSELGSIMAATKHPKEAWEVLSFLGGDEGDWIRMQYMPHAPADLGSPYMSDWTNRMSPVRVDVFLKQMESGRLLPYSKLQANAAQIQNVIQQHLVEVYKGNQPAKQAVQEIDQQVNGILQSH